MSLETQGTYLYLVDPDNGQVLEVGCVTSIDGIDTTNEQIEDTCLSAQARTYKGGLATPGAATFGINFDPSDVSHVRLHQLKVAKTTLNWAVGLADSPDILNPSLPTVDSAGNFVLPADRSWISFEGFMTSFPFSFQQNSVIQSTVSIQISGEPEIIPKTA